MVIGPWMSRAWMLTSARPPSSLCVPDSGDLPGDRVVGGGGGCRGGGQVRMMVPLPDLLGSLAAALAPPAGPEPSGSVLGGAATMFEISLLSRLSAAPFRPPRTACGAGPAGTGRPAGP